MKTIINLLSLLLIFQSCSNKEKSKINSYNHGSMTVYTDESFQNVVKALADAYMMNYPDTKIKVQTTKEDLAFVDLLNNKSKLVAISKPLSTNEIKLYEKQTELKYQADYFAVDAVVFVVSKNANLRSITMDEIKSKLQDDGKTFILDGANSSNINFVASKLNLPSSQLKYSVIQGNENLIAHLHKYPGKIGAVSLNSFSRPYQKEAESLRNKVQLLAVVDKQGTFLPSIENLRIGRYPFMRPIYFLNNESGFGIAKGFIRFSCTQLGQLVVSKEGIKPYNFYKREVRMKE